MTGAGDKTQVETGELRAWGRGALDRSDRLNQIANDTAGINLGYDALGAIHQAFCDDLQAQVRAMAARIRDTARYLETDSDNADAVADTFDDVNLTQADRFTKGGGRG